REIGLLHHGQADAGDRRLIGDAELVEEEIVARAKFGMTRRREPVCPIVPPAVIMEQHLLLELGKIHRRPALTEQLGAADRAQLLAEQQSGFEALPMTMAVAQPDIDLVAVEVGTVSRRDESHLD